MEIPEILNAHQQDSLIYSIDDHLSNEDLTGRDWSSLALTCRIRILIFELVGAVR
jgi:hypothetical protein